MSYAGTEISLEAGAPVELYEFRQAAAKAWHFASCAEAVTVSPATYQPAAIVRTRIKQTTDITRDGITLTFPRGNEFAQQFIGAAPDAVTTVTVLRGHVEDGEFIVYWKGRVVGASAGDNAIDLECESIFTSLSRPGLRARYEPTCRHILYGVGCGVNPAAHKLATSVVSITGLDVSLGGVWTAPDGYYAGGELVAPDGTRRFITAQVNNAITLNRHLPGLVGGMPVEVYPGCDHLASTCLGKFSNLDNFGGFPYIPPDNPMGGKSII